MNKIYPAEFQRVRFGTEAMIFFDKLRRFQKHAAFRKHYFADTPVDFVDFGEFRREKFPNSGPACWLDRPDAFYLVEQRLAAGEISDADAEICRKWIIDGYWIAKKLISESTLDQTWASYQKALESGLLGSVTLSAGGVLPDRKLDPHKSVPDINKLLHHAAVMHITDLLLGRKTMPFQTIMGHAGSQQSAHSDAIHMTTYPLGYLIANWIAFENVHPESGPVEYFPKSHRLPYLLSAECGIQEWEFKTVGASAYSERYEPAVRDYCAKYGFEKHVFLAEKGDVLFWHANLVHGGAPRKNLDYSRRALVCHHFAQGSVTYHDLSGNPSRLHVRGMYKPVVPEDGATF
jgi:hypothetical protein